MVARFYIYKGRRWVELDAVTGKLNGVQEKPRFLYVSKGTLQVARSSKVLRGLQSMSAGLQSTVTTGYTLIQKRKRKHRQSMSRRQNNYCSCMCNNRQSCQNTLAITAKNISDAVTQTSIQDNTQIPVREAEPNIQIAGPNISQQSINGQNSRSKEPEKLIPESNSRQNGSEESNTQKTCAIESGASIRPIDVSESISNTNIPRDITVAPELYMRNSTPESEPSRELYIDIDDVNSIKVLLSKHPEFLGPLDGNRFETDENYRNEILFKLNPLVKVAKTKNLDDLVKKNSDELDLRQFAAMLGLTHVEDKVANNYVYKTRQTVEQLNSNFERNKKRRYNDFSSNTDEDDKENNSKGNKPRPEDKDKIIRTDSSSDWSEYSKRSLKKVNRKPKNTTMNSSSSDESKRDRLKRSYAEISASSDSDGMSDDNDKSPAAKRRQVESTSTDEEKENKTQKSSSTPYRSRPRLKNLATSINKVLRNKPNSKDELPSLATLDSSSLKTNSKKHAHSPKNKTDEKGNRAKGDIVTILSDTDDNFQKETSTVLKTKLRNEKKQESRRTSKEFRKKMLPIPTQKKLKLMKNIRDNNSSNGGVNNPYSSLEDHAIVAWIAVGGRDRKVNGNKVWREFQTSYHNITGTQRSWHSLRNRYLRYILPSLGSLCLESSLQTKLRAGAARGELKLKRKNSLNKRNSLLEVSPVQSAWSRRCRSPLKRPESPQKRPNTPQKRSNSPQKQPESARKGNSAAKKQLPKIRMNPDVEIASTYTPAKDVNSVRSLRSSGGLNSPSYSELTKKFADKHRYSTSTNSGKISPLPEPEVRLTKTRRLFNPRAI